VVSVHEFICRKCKLASVDYCHGSEAPNTTIIQVGHKYISISELSSDYITNGHSLNNKNIESRKNQKWK
jgi:hypothetical protein